MKKKLYLISLGASVLLFAACSRTASKNNLVKETYVHKYGVPLAKNDWNEQGKDGQVIRVLKDGVTITENYLNGTLNGRTTYSFPHSSTIQKVAVYDQGNRIAEILHYPSGVPMKEKHYKNNALVQITTWYEDGTPSGLETYDNGLLVSGEYRNTFNAIDARVQEGQGIRLKRNNNGQLVNKDIFQNGQMIERLVYYTSGEPSSITSYENDLIHGQKMTFLPGGLPKTVEQWVHGKQEGITISYQNGEKIAEIPYHLGKKHGVEKLFHDGTAVVEEISWVNDVRHGPSVICIDGETKTEWYHQGEIVSRLTYERMNLR